MEEEKLGYLYFHRRKDTNEVFYVGIGCAKYYGRAKVKCNRSSHWKNIVNKVQYYKERLKQIKQMKK